MLLEDPGNSLGDRRAIASGPIGGVRQMHRSGVGRNNAAQDIEQRRFAGPVLADEGHNRVGRDLEADIVEHHGAAVGFRQPISSE